MYDPYVIPLSLSIKNNQSFANAISLQHSIERYQKLQETAEMDYDKHIHLLTFWHGVTASMDRQYGQ
jgi:hypothetical protein